MNYWPPTVGTHLGDHVLHTFLSYNLSFLSLSPVTSLIMPTNDGPVLMDFTFEFQNYARRQMLRSKLSPSWSTSMFTTPYSTVAIDRQLLHTYHLIP